MKINKFQMLRKKAVGVIQTADYLCEGKMSIARRLVLPCFNALVFDMGMI
jgi:hypothetical protein